MTASELIEELTKLPQDAKVVYAWADDDLDEIESVKANEYGEVELR